MKTTYVSIKRQLVKEKMYVFTIKYYLAIKLNEVLQFATPWMDLEGIMLSEVTHRKANTIGFHLYVVS